MRQVYHYRSPSDLFVIANSPCIVRASSSYFIAASIAEANVRSTPFLFATIRTLHTFFLAQNLTPWQRVSVISFISSPYSRGEPCSL